MANRNFDILRALGKGVVLIAGSFAPNGSSAIDATSRKGQGWSVAYTSTGLYTVTLTDTYDHLISCWLALQLSAASDQKVEFGAIDVSSAKTIQINAWDISGTALADIAANAANRINFGLILANSSVKPFYG